MKKIKNTLYVFTEDAYLTLDGENVVAKVGSDALGRFPLHTLEGISLFSYAGASPALKKAQFRASENECYSLAVARN